MRRQDESDNVTALAIVLLLVIFMLRCGDAGIVHDDDGLFLYNRCYQVIDCLRNGEYPFIFYQDGGRRVWFAHLLWMVNSTPILCVSWFY